MQLINAPGKLVLPFAASGAKNAIPVASQIGIVAGAASLTDGFPPLTRTPLAAGGVPPSGLDMNGIIYELSAILRWANAGAGYVYDGTFAADSNVGGYPKGARVLRSDGQGYWFNTTDNNTTDPEGAGAVAAGWVPDFTNGVTSVAMASANVTLTPLQYGKPIIVITGTLTANLNLIFPTGMVGEWTVINNTTGSFSVTCKTAAGTGVIVTSAMRLVGGGTNIFSAVDAVGVLSLNVASAGGTADALTASFTPAPRSWSAIAGVPFFVRAASANTTTTPTFAPDGLTAKTIVKGNNLPLVAGDIAGAGHWLEMSFDTVLDKWVLLNPYGAGIQIASTAEAQAYASDSVALTPLKMRQAMQGPNVWFANNGYQKLPSGLIIQWGTLTGITSSDVVTTFPIAFPTNTVHVGIQARGDSNAPSTAKEVDASPKTITTTSFTLKAGPDTGYYGGVFLWFAIGY